MKRMIIGLIMAMFLALIPVGVLSAQKQVVITEVQTGSEASASEEFVEIYNTTNQEIDISGWAMYYKSATGASWSKKTVVNSLTKIQPDDFWVFAANLQGDTQFSSGLSSSGGNIQIRDSQGNVVDQFAWGGGDSALIAPASESTAGQSMFRVYDFVTSTMQNSNNNFNDFDLTNTPTPGTFPQIEQPEVEQQALSYPELYLSELFPDPASPQSDSTDEFIEIYNPNSFAVDLSGWKLRDEGGDEFIIKGKSVDSNSRLAIFVGESKITLNNSGDSIQLIDPNGQINDESANYGVAEEGLSWSFIAGAWQWAVTSTPGMANSAIYIDTNPASSVESVKKATSKKKSTKKAASTKPKTSKLKSTPASVSNTPGMEASESQAQPSPWWSWLLVGLGAVTIGYGIYEYRTEIHLFFKKLGAKFGIGTKTG